MWHRFAFDPHIREGLADSKGIIFKKNIRKQIVLPYIYNFHTKNIGVNEGSFVVHCGFIEMYVPKIGDFVVEYPREFEAIFQKASGAKGELDEKNQRSTISCQDPFNMGSQQFVLPYSLWLE
jgi:hypothetical protein